ncbi:cell division protein FtsA [Candidatus Peregrinibacteria bacterium]|jgi:cell division protein FtsA|nr:cell division protein FtsA [Candidatus Peregrinibacteria bacterium]MBT4631784.1 cell division protein FtsA [Candidatus Peregrinibacteria bacterium]MBT5516847.1 cell division protein FtsA [Candidatus Peregrinibacteria bacterium]MBT5824491.1 cell division protein FtsA [Candidatus Peregrinibacteria bacterium]
MAKHKVIAGLDIGNSKIRTVVAVMQENSTIPNILGVGVSPSGGLRKGNVIDVEEAVTNISAALEDAERMAGEPVHHVFLGIGGDHISSQDSKGVIAISHSGNEIIEDDIDRVLEAAQAVSIPSNRRILRIIPKGFTVDEQSGIKYPVGMTGIRLEVLAHLVTGLVPAVKNIEKCVHQAGVDINDIIPSGLAAAESVLTKRQKELGVVVIDVGCGGTNVAVFEEGTVLHSAALPVGGENVTNDIAIGMRTSIDTAEKIKIEYGTCIPEDVHDRETIDLSLLSKIDTQTVSKKQLAEIVQARYHEIFLMVKDELAKVQRDGMLPAGAILTGAAVKMPGVLDVAREILNLPVQIGFPTNYEGVVDKIEDPAYATVIGLVIWGSRFQGEGYGLKLDLKGLSLDKMAQGVKGWLRGLLP